MDSSSGQLALARGYTLWFSGLVPAQDGESEKDMEHVMEPIADINTVEEFWAVYQYLVKPDEADFKTCYHFFQEGIKPIWEDEGNKNGGRWHIWLPKGQTNKLWEDLLIHLIGNQFANSDDVCGVEVRIKPRGDSLSIWHKDASNEDEKNKIRDEFMQVLGSSEVGIKVQYHRFTESLEFQKNKENKHSVFTRKNKKD